MPRPTRARRSHAHRSLAERLEDRRMLSASLLKDIYPGPNTSMPGFGTLALPLWAPVEIRPGAAGDARLVFDALAADGTYGVWGTDGTADGTVRLTPEGTSVIAYALASLGDRAVFATRDNLARTTTLWVTDGTPGGTRPYTNGTSPALEDFNSVNADSFTASGGYVYFSAASTSDIRDRDFNLWRTDGTAAGTQMVKDLADPTFDPTDSAPRNLTDVNGTLYFTTSHQHDQVFGNELWKTDGTEAGTVMVRSFELPPTTTGKPADNLTNADGTLYFTVGNIPRTALWKSDGTEAGTAQLAEFDLIGKSGARGAEEVLSPVGTRVVFSARPIGSADNEPWASDGTPEGTMRLKDIFPGGFGSQPDEFISAGDRVFFVALTSEWGREPYVTDGTPEGTHLIADVTSPPSGSSVIAPLEAAEGVMYFSLRPRAGVGEELWVTDGTAAGTRPVRDVNPGGASSSPRLAAIFGDKLAFWADDGVHGYEPWVAPHAPAARPPHVVARRVLYNNSAFDGGNPAADAADDAAIAPRKVGLLPGDSSNNTHFSNYARGLNAVVVDIAALPAGATPGAGDFSFRRVVGRDPSAWAPAAAPASVSVRRGAGVGGSDRVTLVWPDYDPADPDSAAANGWLEVTVKATPNTGLASPDVFAFGNLIGDASGDGSVNALDLGAVKSRLNTAATIDTGADLNRDGRVNALDLGILKRYLNRSLGVTVMPAPKLAPPAPAAGGATTLVLEQDASSFPS